MNLMYINYFLLLQSPHKPYKPLNNALTCKDSMCTFPQHPQKFPCHDPSDQCDYEIEYADHGSSLGVLVKDDFPLQFLNGSTTRTSLVFGSVPFCYSKSIYNLKVAMLFKCFLKHHFQTIHDMDLEDYDINFFVKYICEID